MSLAARFADVLIRTLGSGAELHEPYFGGSEIDLLTSCVNSGYVSSVGQFVNRFEERLSTYTGSKQVIAVTNGTAALQLAGVVAGIKPNQEVLVPALSFVATANAFAALGAIPHFVDVGKDTYGIDPDYLDGYLRRIAVKGRGADLINKETGRQIVAVVPVHTFGHPCAIDEIKQVADHFGLFLIEDAAEALGSFYKGKHVGTFGDIGILSFNGNKIITTGGGGALLTNNESYATKARHISTTAKIQHPWDYFHDQIGFNWRMPNLNAALGCAQMEQLDDFVKKKRDLWCIYKSAFEELSQVEIFSPSYQCSSQTNFWLQTAVIQSATEELIESILLKCHEKGFRCRRPWTLLSDLPAYARHPRSSLDVSKQIRLSCINLPSSAFLSTDLLV